MKKTFFSLLIMVMVMILTIPACKNSDETNFNVVGSWQFIITPSGDDADGPYKTDFVGDVTQGTWKLSVDQDDFITGTYEVVGNVIKMIITDVSYEEGVAGYFTGQFEKFNKMSGTFQTTDNGYLISGTWMAIR